MVYPVFHLDKKYKKSCRKIYKSLIKMEFFKKHIEPLIIIQLISEYTASPTLKCAGSRWTNCKRYITVKEDENGKIAKSLDGKYFVLGDEYAILCRSDTCEDYFTCHDCLEYRTLNACEGDYCYRKLCDECMPEEDGEYYCDSCQDERSNESQSNSEDDDDSSY